MLEERAENERAWQQSVALRAEEIARAKAADYAKVPPATRPAVRHV